MDREKLRHIAIKMHSFKVMEGLTRFQASVPWPNLKVVNYGKTSEVEVYADILLDGDNLTITIKASKSPVTSHNKTVYNGPIQWLSGVVDYSGPDDD